MTIKDYEKYRKAKSEARRFKRKYLSAKHKLEYIKGRLAEHIEAAQFYIDDDFYSQGYEDGLGRAMELFEEVENESD